jgi:hypothetical protein
MMYSHVDDEPLLEELGINLNLVWYKAQSILLNRRFYLHNDSDLSGPVIIACILGCLHLITGNLHFGIILGWSIVTSGILCFVVNMLAEGSYMTVHKALSIIGYCQIPTVIYSALTIVMPQGMIASICGFVCMTWSSYTCSSIIVYVVPTLHDIQLLMFPCMLIFSAFTLLTVKSNLYN